jgi:hypothetical protein
MAALTSCHFRYLDLVMATMTSRSYEIKKMWRIFPVSLDSTLEIRALWPKGVAGREPPIVRHLSADNHENVEGLKQAFEVEALELNDLGYNIYTTLNPLRAGFDGAGGAKDKDIRHRNLLLIDIDRVGDTSRPADQNELNAAKTLADTIRRHMMKREWPDPSVVMSGNGFHLYYRLGGMPNDSAAGSLIARTLMGLAAKFNNDVVGVDKSVYNASRITKVPGTLMRKGEASVDRPYRVAVVCDEE